MFNDRYKVIGDNGIKIELLRQVKDVPFRYGASISLKEIENSGSTEEVFNNLIDEKTKEEIYKNIETAIRAEIESKEKVSNK